jgi:hypothetical protein
MYTKLLRRLARKIFEATGHCGDSGPTGHCS